MKLINILGTIGYEMIVDFFRMIKNGVPKISAAIKIALPFMMYYYGRYESKNWHCLLLPLIAWFVCAVFDRFAEKTGNGKNIPVPTKRFTEEGSDGEVSIEQDRLQEMILYVNDVENYLERHHIM